MGGERHHRGVAGPAHGAPAGVVVVEHRENEGMTLKVGSKRTRRDMPFVEVFDLSRYLVFEGMGRRRDVRIYQARGVFEDRM